MTAKLVIFDADGVLLDSEEIVFSAFKNAFADHKIKISIDAFRKAQGLPLPEFCFCIHSSITQEQAKKTCPTE